MEPVAGLRARKKEQTRQAIATAAFELFALRGFDRVTVAEIARRADVSEATVFNHFRTKEELIYRPLEEYEAALVAAVRDRPPGQPVVDAFAAFLVRQQGLLANDDPNDEQRLATVSRIITESPALLARERQVYEDHVTLFAGVLANESSARPDDIRPWIVANALIGAQRALVDRVRTSVLAGRRGPALARQARIQAEQALAVLGQGLADYLPRTDQARGKRTHTS